MSQYENAFYNEIYASLGGHSQGVDIEMSTEDIDICVKKAIRTMKQYGSSSYKREFYGLAVEKDKTEYNLPDRDQDNKHIDTIVKIIRPSFDMFNIEDAFSMATYQDLMTTRSTWGIGGEVHMLTIELTLWLKEQHERYAAHGVQFNHDPFKNTITLFNRPKADEIWFLDCYLELEPEDYIEIPWIVDWTIAEAHLMLGKAYQKMSSLPGPTGDFQLPGRELIDEGNRMKEQLIEQLKDGIGGSDDYWAIMIG